MVSMIFSLSLLLLSPAVGFAKAPVARQNGLIRPGIQLSSSQVEELRERAASGKDPWKVPYDNLKSHASASASYVMQGPGSAVGHGTGNETVEEWANAWDADILAAYLNSLQFAITDDDSHARKVAEIIDAWAAILVDFNDSALAACTTGRDFVNAAELVRHLRGSWPTGEDKFNKAQEFVSKIMVNSITMGTRPPEQPAIGGGQGFCKRIAALEFAVFTNNQTGFDQEMTLLKQPGKCEAEFGTTLQAMFLPATGQCAESGRDQGHSSNDVAWFEEMAQVAANQGDTSLFEFAGDDGKDTPLLALGMEYYFKYNVGNDDVPYDVDHGPCCCGKVRWGSVSEDQRGNTYKAGEIGYRYYKEHDRSLGFTKQWLSEKRAVSLEDAGIGRYLGFWTLLWGLESL